VPGYELKRDEALAHQQVNEKRASKNRYRASQEKNQAIAKKNAKKASSSKNPSKKYNTKIKKKR
jgi:ATP-dependent RNA helicase RhlE